MLLLFLFIELIQFIIHCYTSEHSLELMMLVAIWQPIQLEFGRRREDDTSAVNGNYRPFITRHDDGGPEQNKSLLYGEADGKKMHFQNALLANYRWPILHLIVSITSHSFHAHTQFACFITNLVSSVYSGCWSNCNMQPQCQCNEIDYVLSEARKAFTKSTWLGRRSQLIGSQLESIELLLLHSHGERLTS